MNPTHMPARRSRVLPTRQPRLQTALAPCELLAPIPPWARWQRDYLFSCSWMNFPKRLLLLFLSVHAFPAGHTSGYMAPPSLESSGAQVAAQLLGACFYPPVI